MSFTRSLDHIIILVPQSTLTSIPPSISSSFTVYPGGTHADNKTLNSLILLKSGVYLELISFVNDDPEKKQGHWWGKKTPGTIIDFALTSASVSDVEIVRKTLGNHGVAGDLNVGYQGSKIGGRKRPDGGSVEWKITFPTPSTERGTTPFWCHDITPRDLRVPITSSPSSTEHTSGAIGVSKLILVVSSSNFQELKEIYAKILGSEATQLENGDIEFLVTQPTPNSSTSSILLRKASSPEEKCVVETNGGIAGLWEIVLAVTGSAPPPITEKIDSGVLRISFEKESGLQ